MKNELNILKTFFKYILARKSSRTRNRNKVEKVKIGDMETFGDICSVNQWTGFYMIRTTVIKELKMMKSAFHFILKVSFVLKTFKFLS